MERENERERKREKEIEKSERSRIGKRSEETEGWANNDGTGPVICSRQ